MNSSFITSCKKASSLCAREPSGEVLSRVKLGAHSCALRDILLGLLLGPQVLGVLGPSGAVPDVADGLGCDAISPRNFAGVALDRAA
eukprot:1934312-Rhodomonas_salina.2